MATAEEFKRCEECGADINGAPVCLICMKYPYNAARPLCDPCFDKRHRHRRPRVDPDSL